MSTAPNSDGTNTASMTIMTTVRGLFLMKEIMASSMAERMFIR